MRALTKTAAGRGHLELIERPAPTVGPGQALIEVHAVGVCGTDLHIEAGEYATATPVTLGHEVAGIVLEVADDSDQGWTGRRVVTETFYSTCLRCQWCVTGAPNLCPDRRSIGTHADGGFAAHLVIPVTNLHQVPGWLDLSAAALAEPLACVCQCLLDPAAVQAGDRVAVIGPGPMGSLAAQVARHMGGSVVVHGLPEDEERLSLLAQLGFDTTTSAPEPGCADVAVECSGSTAGLAAGLRCARKGGRIVQVGVFGAEVTVSLENLVHGELLVSSGFAATPQSWLRAMKLVATKAVDLAPLVTKVAPLDEWAQVMAELRKGQGMKIIVNPQL